MKDLTWVALVVLLGALAALVAREVKHLEQAAPAAQPQPCVCQCGPPDDWQAAIYCNDKVHIQLRLPDADGGVIGP